MNTASIETGSLEMRFALAALAALIASTAPASGHEFTSGALVVDHPWASPSPAGQSQGSVYFTIENAGGEPDRLVGVSTRVGQAILHNNAMDGDVVQMTDMDSIDVPARGDVVFAPGGRHVMVTGLAEPLALGDRFAMTLTFEHAGDIEVEVQVESLASHLRAPAPAGEAGHGHHDR